MDTNITTIDKTYLKKTILKSKMFSVVDFLLIILLFSSILISEGKNTWELIGVMLLAVNIVKVAIILNQIRCVEEDDFQIVKGIITSERISEGEDSNTYYKTFWCGSEYGYVEKTVGKKFYDTYLKGDCFYVVLLKKEKKKKNPAYVFSFNEHTLATALAGNYMELPEEEYVACRNCTEEKEVAHKWIPYSEILASLTPSQKEAILETGKKIDKLRKIMLISGITLFVLLIVLIATFNIWVLSAFLCVLLVFAFTVYRTFLVMKENPDYSGWIYMDLKEKARRYDAVDEESNYECSLGLPEEFCEEEKPRKNLWTFKFRKFLSFLILALMLLALFANFSQGEKIEWSVVLFFSFSSIICLLMLFTKIRVLSPTFITAFLLATAVDSVIEKEDISVTIICAFIGLLFAIPTLAANSKR